MIIYKCDDKNKHHTFGLPPQAYSCMYTLQICLSWLSQVHHLKVCRSSIAAWAHCPGWSELLTVLSDVKFVLAAAEFTNIDTKLIYQFCFAYKPVEFRALIAESVCCLYIVTCGLNVVLSAMFGIFFCRPASVHVFLSVLRILGTQPSFGPSTIFSWFETVSVHLLLIAEHQVTSSWCSCFSSKHSSASQHSACDCTAAMCRVH